LKTDKRDFDRHEGTFVEIAPSSDALFLASVHRTKRGAGSGGVRYWPYPSFKDVLVDCLRLSQGMGRKNALAGLWWSGGKGVIARTPDNRHMDRSYRDTLFREWGSFVTSIRGCYYTAEDVGVTVPDIARAFERTRFITCIPPTVGGSGNPSINTGYGVVCGMEGALSFLNMGTLKGKRVAVQGLGNVATYVIDRLCERGVGHVVATDINQTAVQAAQARWRGQPVEVKLVNVNDDSDLYAPNLDILSPCALGGTLNPTTIPKITAKIVCGAANNQLLDAHRDGDAITARGISYVPDFLANRMGIVTCADEWAGSISPNKDPIIERHFGSEWHNAISVMTGKVLTEARQQRISSATAAIRLADQLLEQNHPIFPNRTRNIIDSLVQNKWHSQPYNKL